MVPRVQRLGAGPWGVAAATFWASGPGPWRSRSWSSSFLLSSKTLAASAALLVALQAVESLGEEGVQPGVDGVGAARAEDALACDGVGGSAVGDLQQGGGAFTDVGLGMVVAVFEQSLPLLVGEAEGTALAHGRFLHSMLAPTVIVAPLPALIGQVHQGEHLLYPLLVG